MIAIIIDDDYLIGKLMDNHCFPVEEIQEFLSTFRMSLTRAVFELIIADEETFDFTGDLRNVGVTNYSRLLSLQALVNTTGFLENQRDPVGDSQFPLSFDLMLHYSYSVYLEYLLSHISVRCRGLPNIVLRFEWLIGNRLVTYL